jgi:hypothetical protein
MRLQGSCHCRAVRFSLRAAAPYPYMHCYCSICRKTAGGGGYAINLGGDAASLEITGKRHMRVYRVQLGEDEPSPARRHFCGRCGSALWVFDPRWPELVHPFASAIDTPLPRPPGTVEIMLSYAAPWCETGVGAAVCRFDEYPDESLEAWHRRHGIHDEGEKT